MSDLVTYGIELGVGIACLALVVPAWRRDGWLRWIAVGLSVAGVVAVVHAVQRLV